MEQLGSHWTHFHEIWYLRVFRKSVDKIQVSLKSSKNRGYFTWRPREPGSSVGLATGYGLDCPGIEPRWGRDFRTCPDRRWGPTSLLYIGYRVFAGGKERPGHDADTSPPSSAVVKKEYSYTPTPPMGRTACTEPQCLYKGALYLLTYMKPTYIFWSMPINIIKNIHIFIISLSFLIRMRHV